MFPYAKIKELNGLEAQLFNYINSNQSKVIDMTIRQLSKASGVSPTTILRFAEKMGYEGYSEMRFALKRYRETQDVKMDESTYDITSPLVDFFSTVNSDDFSQLIDKAMELIVNSKLVLLFGVGTGQALAQYGARYWTKAGQFALAINDTSYHFPKKKLELTETVLVLFSVYGEDDHFIELASKAQENKMKIISVTNHGDSTLAKMSDLTIAYYLPDIPHKHLELSTQIPISYLIEVIAHRIDEHT